MKKALITGVTGQDGAYLAEFLLNRNEYASLVLEVRKIRSGCTEMFWRLYQSAIACRADKSPLGSGS